MVPFFNKPIMEYVLEKLIRAGVDEVFVLTGYLKERIMNYFEDGSRWGIEIHYSDKDNLKLGTAGATKKVVEKMEDTFIIASSDVLTDLHIKEFYEYHIEEKCIGHNCTLKS